MRSELRNLFDELEDRGVTVTKPPKPPKGSKVTKVTKVTPPEAPETPTDHEGPRPTT